MVSPGRSLRRAGAMLTTSLLVLVGIVAPASVEAGATGPTWTVESQSTRLRRVLLRLVRVEQHLHRRRGDGNGLALRRRHDRRWRALVGAVHPHVQRRPRRDRCGALPHPVGVRRPPRGADVDAPPAIGRRRGDLVVGRRAWHGGHRAVLRNLPAVVLERGVLRGPAPAVRATARGDRDQRPRGLLAHHPRDGVRVLRRRRRLCCPLGVPGGALERSDVGHPPLSNDQRGRHVVAAAGPRLARGAIEVACTSQHRCVASAGGSSHPGFVYATASAGNHWSRVESGTAWGATSLQCDGAGGCTAVWATGRSSAPAIGISTDGGVTWQRATAAGVTGFVDDATCPTPSTCLLAATGQSVQVGQTAALYATTDAGVTWTVVLASSGPAWLDSVACPSPASCLVVGAASSGAYVATSSDGGTTWTPTSSVTGAGEGLWSLTCPTASDCLALAETATAIEIVRSANLGGDVVHGRGAVRREGAVLGRLRVVVRLLRARGERHARDLERGRDRTRASSPQPSRPRPTSSPPRAPPRRGASPWRPTRTCPSSSRRPTAG